MTLLVTQDFVSAGRFIDTITFATKACQRRVGDRFAFNFGQN